MALTVNRALKSSVAALAMLSRAAGSSASH